MCKHLLEAGMTIIDKARYSLTLKTYWGGQSPENIVANGPIERYVII